jgi:hypothetical protein
MAHTEFRRPGCQFIGGAASLKSIFRAVPHSIDTFEVAVRGALPSGLKIIRRGEISADVLRDGLHEEQRNAVPDPNAPRANSKPATPFRCVKSGVVAVMGSPKQTGAVNMISVTRKLGASWAGCNAKLQLIPTTPLA